MGKYLSPSEVSKVLGVSVTRVRNMLKSGKIKGKKVGRQWIISESETKGWKKVQHGTKIWLERESKARGRGEL